MTQYRITSKASADFGVWEGETPEAALRAMFEDSGGEYGSPECGTVDDWCIEEVQAA